MFKNADELLTEAANARRAAMTVSPAQAKTLLAHALECETAAILERLGQLRFEDMPQPPDRRLTTATVG